MLFQLFDPVAMEFKPAELTVIDDSSQDSEIQIFKLTLNFSSTVTVQWIDAEGHLLRQRNESINYISERLYGDTEKQRAIEVLSAKAKSSGLSESMIKLFINFGIEALKSRIEEKL
jgi:hypothetical protein